MQTQNYWQQFESTGRIEDYLSYRASYSRQSGTGSAGCKSDYRETLGRDAADVAPDAPGEGAYPAGMDGDLCRDSFR